VAKAFIGLFSPVNVSHLWEWTLHGELFNSEEMEKYFSSSDYDDVLCPVYLKADQKGEKLE